MFDAGMCLRYTIERRGCENTCWGRYVNSLLRILIDAYLITCIPCFF